MQFTAHDVDHIAKNVDARRKLAGYYHANYSVDVDGKLVLVRIPLVGAETMDLQIWRESELQEVVYRQGIECPRILGFSPDSGVQIHEFVPGVVLDDRWPRGLRVPSHVFSDTVRLFAQLATVPITELPALPYDWPKSGDTAGLFLHLVANTSEIYQRQMPSYGWLYEAIGLPEDPFPALRALAEGLETRPFLLCHCDIHRGNCILQESLTIFIDWEKALYADAAYEVATHLHKSAYQPDEEDRLLDMLIRELPSSSTRWLIANAKIYRKHEQVKSIIVDAVRYHQKARASDQKDIAVKALSSLLTDKLKLAAPVWSGSPPNRESIEEALRS